MAVMSQIVHGCFVCTVSGNFLNLHSIFYYLVEAKTDRMHTTTLIADETVPRTMLARHSNFSVSLHHLRYAPIDWSLIVWSTHHSTLDPFECVNCTLRFSIHLNVNTLFALKDSCTEVCELGHDSCLSGPLANTVLPEDSPSPFLSQPTISLKAICVVCSVLTWACSPVQLLYTRPPLNPFSLSFTSCTSPFNTHTDQRNDSELSQRWISRTTLFFSLALSLCCPFLKLPLPCSHSLPLLHTPATHSRTACWCCLDSSC